MLKLIYTIEGEARSFDLTGEKVSIGRMDGNDLILRDHTVSRNHAEMRLTDAGWCATDLGSRNGMRLNGEPTRVALLKPGDILSIGVVDIRFTEDGFRKVELKAFDGRPLEEEGTIIRSVDEVRAMLEAESARKVAASDTGAIDRLSKVSRILSVLADMAKTLIAASELEEVLEKVMDVIFQHVQAQRGVILLKSESSGELEPRVVRQVGGAVEQIAISQSIAKRSFDEGVAILCSDAQVDPRFQAGESIRLLGIRSALCVPLSTASEGLGLIYVDTPLKVKAYEEFDLELLSALAGFSAMAIHQASLRAKIQEEREAKSRLERYHSPDVIGRILGACGGGVHSLEVREVDATVLFADICGFTSMTEHMPPREVALMLNEIFSRMTDIIFKHEGTLDKFIGDAVMAVFGAPIPKDDHAQRAVACAVDMRAELADFNRKTSPANPLRFRIGLNSGRVVAGDIGSLKRMEYTVLGSTVNLASRLQSEVAKPGQIVAGEATFEDLASTVSCKRIENIFVKGLSKPIVAYEVLA